MRIKKKSPKPSAKRPPLYFIGYRGQAPQEEELLFWYNGQYGGPLTIEHEAGTRESWHVRHGPWTAHVVLPLPATHVVGLKDQLAWEHDQVGAIAPSVMTPRDMPDAILFAARLARGLVLLTQGTAHDLTTQEYLNPSDWQNRSLNEFVADDHVLVAQDDQAKPDMIWCYSLGLSKFGLDELEMFLPRGTSDRAARELLGESIREIIRIGQSPKVGASFDLPLLSRKMTISNHRTAAPGGRMLGFRELHSNPVP
jgi:hypothetical protein